MDDLIKMKASSTIEFSPNQISFSPANHEDVPKLVLLMETAYNDLSNTYLDRDVGPEGYNRQKTHESWMHHMEYYKITHEGEIIGGFIFERDMYYLQRVYLNFMFLNPLYQRKGIGRYVLNFIENLEPRVNVIEANTPLWADRNIEFYTQLNFKIVDRYYDPLLKFSLLIFRKFLHS